jgi:hypothetical protein
MWSACGGANTTYAKNGTDPSVCCPIGATCKFYNDLFWRCVPDYYNGPTASMVCYVCMPLRWYPAVAGCIPYDPSSGTEQHITNAGAGPAIICTGIEFLLYQCSNNCRHRARRGCPNVCWTAIGTALALMHTSAPPDAHATCATDCLATSN